MYRGCSFAPRSLYTLPPAERGKAMIVGNIITPLEVPHEPGNVIHVRELSGLEMDDAREIRSNKVVRSFGIIGGEALVALREARDDGQVDTTVHDPKNDYDWEFLITKAICSWNGPNYDKIECTTENKKLLDRPTLEWLVDRLIERNVVPLVKSLTSVESTKEDTSPPPLNLLIN